MWGFLKTKDEVGDDVGIKVDIEGSVVVMAGQLQVCKRLLRLVTWWGLDVV